MPPNRESFTKEWFRKAKTDLNSAEVLLTAQPPITETAAFLVQQAVEKAIKGFLTFL